MSSPPAPAKVAILLSGTGRTFQNFLQEQAAGRLPVEFCVVIGSTSRARGLDHAREAGIPTEVLARSGFGDPGAYGEALAKVLREHGSQFVAMAGFLHLWTVPEDFEGKVLNIHPSLLPAFGGRGFYGGRVHQAVRDSGVKWTGCTVHFADDHYDTGPIVAQHVVPVHDQDQPQDIADRVFAEECRAYPEALRLLVQGRLIRDGRRVRVLAAVDGSA